MSHTRFQPTTWQVAEDHEQMSGAAADFLAAELRRAPEALLCLATGSSPARTYELLAARGQADRALCARARWLKLDEWGGLAMDHPATCEQSLRRVLVAPLGIPEERFYGWQSRPDDPQAECRRVEHWLEVHGPIDVCVLGLGLNGHLGFNEPAAALRLGPHVATLTETSLTHSMLRGERDAVRFGLTLGMGNILQSRKVLLLVSGAHKAEAMRRFASGLLTPEFPASFLWLHPALTIFADRASLSRVPSEARDRFVSLGQSPAMDRARCVVAGGDGPPA